MKSILLAGIFLFVMLFIGTTITSSPQAYLEAQQAGFSATEIEQGQTYSFGNRLLFWLATFLQLAALVVVAFGGWGVALRNFSLRLTGGRWLPAVILVGLLCFLGLELLDLPVRYARLEYRRHWGMTEQTTLDWLSDYAKSLFVGLVAGGIVYIGFYLLVRWLPRWWWLPAGIGAVAFAIVFAWLLPVLVAPLFNTFTPLGKTTYARLEKNIRSLADKAGVAVQEVYVADASRQSKHTNAYFTGFGATQQIVLYDTLLKEHPDDEIESILAHEIGHWQNAHIIQGIIFGGIGVMIGCFLLAQILRWAVQRRPFDLTSPYDPAGWPLILLLAVVADWGTMPLVHAVTRHFEREADVAALELAGKPQAFIDAEKRLARVNISNVAPTRLSTWLFATHPSVVERIRMAEEWRKANQH